MKDDNLAEQLLVGLKQLDTNIKRLYTTHLELGLHLTDPHLKTIEDMLKVAYVNECLKGLK